MSTSVVSVSARAIIEPAPADSQDDQTGSSYDDWFYRAISGLLGKGNDAGYQLALLTKVPDRSCYRYTTSIKEKRRPPPAYLVRMLLRRDDGYPWLAALMENSNAQWWRELDAAREFLSQYRISKR